MPTNDSERLHVNKVHSEAELETVFDIRKRVFVEEQGVDRADEFDEFEEESIHFIARVNDKPCGAARWRIDKKGVKLERFAVLKSFRGKKIGSALVEAVLKDIRSDGHTAEKMIYLHAQLGAVPLYEKFGFKKAGDLFVECGIQHYEMII